MSTTHEADLRHYELLFILSGDLPEKDFERELEEVKKIVMESIDKVTFEENWGKRNLMHKIKKQTRGYYYLMNFMADPAKILEMNMNIKIYPAVLRHLLMVMPNSYVPGSYKTIAFKVEELTEEEQAAETMQASRRTARANREAPRTSVKEVREQEVVTEAKMKKVEKKLEQILDNPDIDIR